MVQSLRFGIHQALLVNGLLYSAGKLSQEKQVGTFSKCCAKSHLPVLMDDVWGKQAPRLTHVVALMPDGSRRVGEYDGYGMDLDDYGSAKFVLQAFYAGENFDELPESGDEPEQGYFHAPEFVAALETLSGFTTYQDYRSAVIEYRRLLSSRVKAGFEVNGFSIPLEHQYGAYSLLEMASVKFPPSMESLQREQPEAAVYLPQTFEALREAALKFDEAFRALATSQAHDIVARYGQKL
jgi:hypothetical protein